jgi:hypothetical protein
MKRGNYIQKIRSVCSITAFLAAIYPANAQKTLPLQPNTATTIAPMRLYGDSTFTKPSEKSLVEGEIVEIIAETQRAYEDNSQRQKFKWYRVRTLKGDEGWLFGDNLAVMLPDAAVSEVAKPFFRRQVSFDNGFENAVIWFGQVEGRENIHKQDFMNPIYRELYLIVTNELGKSATILIGGAEQSGKKELRRLEVFDVTGNRVPEIILETTNLPSNSNIENRQIEIHGFQAGTLQKIFDEPMTLSFDGDMPSPALSKQIEIEGTNIRISYVDFVSPEKYSLGLPTQAKAGSTTERCLEFVTRSLVWDEKLKRFINLYRETRSTPLVTARRKVYLKDAIPTTYTVPKKPIVAKPNKGKEEFVSKGNEYPRQPDEEEESVRKMGVKPLIAAQFSERLQVIKQVEKYMKMEDDTKILEHFFLVRHASGAVGYVNARDVHFRYSDHADLLNRYYNNPPLSKIDWQGITNTFLVLNK